MNNERIARELVAVARELTGASTGKLVWGLDYLGEQLKAMAKDIKDEEYPLASTVPQALRALRKVEDDIERFKTLVRGY